MRKMFFVSGLLLLALLLAACSAPTGAVPTTSPTTGASYPPVNVPMVTGGEAAYPAGESTVTAQLLEKTTAAQDPNMVRLHIKVISAAAPGGTNSPLQSQVEKDTDVYADANAAAAINVNDTFTALVVQQGEMIQLTDLHKTP